MSGRALLKGDSLRLSDVESIAKRLYVLGLLFNNVPENQVSFIGWDSKKLKDSKLWELAAELYQAGLRVSPSTEAQLTLARMQGFLGRWKAAASAYSNYFDTQGSLFDPASGKLLKGTTSDVILAKLEEAVCEEETALAENDSERFLRAEQIFRDLDKAVPVDGDLWWYARYYLVKTLYDRGDYKEALGSLKDAERATNVLGGKTNLVGAFTELKKNVESKAGPR
jgi:tetratricopeptide (TPR) repeat protein